MHKLSPFAARSNISVLYLKYHEMIVLRHSKALKHVLNDEHEYLKHFCWLIVEKRSHYKDWFSEWVENAFLFQFQF